MSLLLPWQQSQWQRLHESRQQGRLPHALLLTGPQGLGKGQFATLLAQSLLCQSNNADATPCGQCRYCQLFLAGSHPDVSLISPLEGKKAIAVDQIRVLGQFMALKSQYAGHKLVVINPAEAMNINASNSLLKTLEEPSAETVLLLVTHQPARLPATIRSRCQEIRFGISETVENRAWLAQQLPAGADVDLLLSLAGGAPFRAIQLADEGLLELRQTLFDGLGQLARLRLDPVSLANQLNKANPAWALLCLYSWLADMIRLRATNRTPDQLSNPDLHEPLLTLANQVSLAGLFKLQDRVRQAQQEFERNLNPALIMESVLMEWQNTFRIRKRKIA
ncbi:MAG TPA: DNA polymerase III subunit delta' [Candidatus Tenderia electrophaga]|uniref:DNA polymerase III subunit delta' n=1 Tax=Candidatus Tenderia electrophaga TaxID=1748243 RepID=A0A832J9J5_9GAMM|nr:DNA polymerase III subunit delta' [Candidatus Tenderia electrophaga]